MAITDCARERFINREGDATLSVDAARRFKGEGSTATGSDAVPVGEGDCGRQNTKLHHCEEQVFIQLGTLCKATTARD